MGLPPSEAGAVKMTLAKALPPVAFTPVGAPGTVTGVTLLEGLESGPTPLAFFAWLMLDSGVVVW